MINYTLVRSGRKTVAIYVRPDGSVEVRAPYRTKMNFIEAFVREKEDWIRKNQEKLAERRAGQRIVELSPAQVGEAKRKAGFYLSERCAYFARRMGVDYGGIKINSAKSRWGSCTSGGNLNFTYRLIFAAPELIDYVVVHELAHRREMNHSAKFWAVVARELPDYQSRRDALRGFQRDIAFVEKGD